MGFQLLSTLLSYLVLFGLILLAGKSTDINLQIQGRRHLLQIALRLAIVIVITATPCVLLGAHPLLITGLLLLLPIAAFPFVSLGLGLPVVMLYGWITMKPGTTVVSLITHNDESLKPTSGRPLSIQESCWINKIGTAHTVLRPQGQVTIDNVTLEAKAQIGIIQAGRRVRVTHHENGVLVVEEVNED